MSPTKNILATTAILFLASNLAVSAEVTRNLKPLHGMSFHSGSMHAAAYFLSDKDACRLVLTLADDTNYAPTRFENTIGDGASTVYPLSAGKTLEFTCHADGRRMSINEIETVAHE